MSRHLIFGISLLCLACSHFVSSSYLSSSSSCRSIPILRKSSNKNWNTVYITFAYTNTTMRPWAHLWEHLVVHRLREKHPGYLYAGQNFSSYIQIECTCPAYDITCVIETIFSTVFFSNWIQHEFAIETSLLLLELEKSQISELYGTDFYTMSQNLKVVRDDAWQYFHINITIDPQPLSSHRRKNTANFCMYFPEGAIWGNMMAIHLSRVIYKNYIHTGKEYWTVSQYKDNFLQLFSSQEDTYKDLLAKAQEPISDREWDILFLRTYLYLSKTGKIQEQTMDNFLDLLQEKYFISREQRHFVARKTFHMLQQSINYQNWHVPIFYQNLLAK